MWQVHSFPFQWVVFHLGWKSVKTNVNKRMRNAFYWLLPFFRSIANLHALWLKQLWYTCLWQRSLRSTHTAIFSIRLKVNESRFNSVWGSLIYRCILMQDAQIPFFLFVQNLPQIVMYIYIYKNETQDVPVQMRYIVNVFKLRHLQFSQSKRPTHQKHFAGNVNNMERSDIAVEWHILQSFHDKIGK